ncbi:hypothetical protein [Natrarchaeobaculum sulfurireducens]|uniref:Uncharacterized protein n=1 Tax=Natrarchaeobaculum sulfurireducens TaxID=2044521 RepID=A0A346PL28_9EURY|nr:hypothetical protein [Natrarchaeobaculum sulfurireducens]AXR80223.1 hypothetical protein AArcMg_0200 [Natrarchaeobaculum sulfurireducens]
MAESRRPSLHSAAGNLSRTLGTLVAVCWLVLASSVALARTTDGSVVAESLPLELFWAVAFVLAAVGAMWLVGGGYDRIGADPTGVWSFVWLAIFLLPLAFVPLRVAVGFVDPTGSLLDTVFVVAVTVVAGWLAFYGGLERLSLTLDDVVRVVVFVVALGSISLAAIFLFDVDWVARPPIAVVVALTIQAAACWLGLSRELP